MSLDLQQIRFKVETDELELAVKKIEALGDSVEGLATSIKKLDKEATDANKTQSQTNLNNAKTEALNIKNAKGLRDAAAATEELTEATRKRQSVEERQEAITRNMADGYSRGQASILATAEAAGEATDRIGELLKTQRAMQGVSPFDRSLGAATVFANELRVLTVANDLYNQDLGFTKNQLMELGREHVRMTEQFKIQGKSLAGLDAEFNSVVQSAQQVTQAENAMAASMKNGQKATMDAGKANAYIENELQKVRFALQANNEELNRSTSNSLVRFENALKKSGLTLDQQRVKIDEYRKSQIELQKTQKANQTDYITRAVGPQITDIIVGLSTGQSPLTVMMQQGGQLRDQFGMMGIAAEDMSKVMRNAMSSMAKSVFDTGKAIGGMLVGGIFDAGKAVTNFTMELTGMNKKFEETKRGYAALGEEGFSKISNLMKIQSIAAGLVAAALAGIVVGLIAWAVATKQIIEEESKLSKALNLTGASLGLTKDSAVELASSMKDVGATTSQGIEVITAMAKTGIIGAESIRMVTEAAVLMERYAGVAIEDTVKAFEKMKEKPVESMVELAKATGTVTPETIRLIYELESQGKTAEAASIAMKALADANASAAKRIQEDLHPLQKLYMGIGDGIKYMWNSFKDVTRSDPSAMLSKAYERLASYQINPKAHAANIEAERILISQLSAKIRLEGEGVRLRQEQSEAAVATAKWEDIKLKSLGYAKKEATEIAKIEEAGLKAGISKVEIQQQINAVIAKRPKAGEAKLTDEQKELNKAREEYIDIQNKAIGVSKEFNNQLDRQKLLFTVGEISKEKYVQLTLDLLKTQKFYTDGLSQEEKAQKAAQKAAADHMKLVEEFTKIQDEFTVTSLKNQEGIQQENSALSLRAELLGKTEEEQKKINESYKAQGELSKINAKYDKERLELQQKYLKLQADGFDVDYDVWNKQIQQSVQQQGEEAKLVWAGVAMNAAESMQKEFDAIKSSITDVITTALFDGGKAGSKKLRDQVVAAFRNKITVVIDAVVNTALSSLMGGSGGSTGGAGGGGSSGLSVGAGLDMAANNFLYNASASLYKAGFDTLGGLTTQLANSTSSLLGSVGGLSNGLSYLNALNTAFSRNAEGGKDFGQAAGQAIGAYFGGPLGSMIGGKIGKALGIVDYSGTAHTGGSASYSRIAGTSLDASKELDFGPGSGMETSKAVTETSAIIAKGIVGLLDQTAVTFGKESGYYAATAFADDISPDGSWGALKIKLGESILTDWEKGADTWPGREFGNKEQGMKEYTEAIALDVRSAINAIGLPDWAMTMLDNLGDAPSLESLEKTIQAITEIQSVSVFLGETLGITTDSVTSLVNVIGSASTAFSLLEGFYQNFYREDEQVAASTKNLTEAFADLNIELPAINEKTRDWYRSEVQKLGAMDLSVEANARAYASILGLQGAVNQLAPAFAEVENTVGDAVEAVTLISEVTKRLQSEGASLQSQWNELALSSEELFAVQTQGMTDLQIAQVKTNESLKYSIRSLTEVATATKTTSDLRINLLRAQGKSEEANALQRMNEMSSLTYAGRAAYVYNEALQDQIDLLNEAAALQTQQRSWQDSISAPNLNTLAERLSEAISTSGASPVTATELLGMSLQQLKEYALDLTNDVVSKTVTKQNTVLTSAEILSVLPKAIAASTDYSDLANNITSGLSLAFADLPEGLATAIGSGLTGIVQGATGGGELSGALTGTPWATILSSVRDIVNTSTKTSDVSVYAGIEGAMSAFLNEASKPAETANVADTVAEVNDMVKVLSDYNRALLEAQGDSSGLAEFDRKLSDAALIAQGWTQVQVDTVNSARVNTKDNQIQSDYNRALLEASGDTSGLAEFDRKLSDAALIAQGWTQVQVDNLTAARDNTKAKEKTDALIQVLSDYNRALLEAQGDNSGLAKFDKAISDAALLAAGWTQAQIDLVDSTRNETQVQARNITLQERINSFSEEGRALNRAIQLQRELSGALSDSERSLIYQVYALEDLEIATATATQAAETLKSAMDSLESARVSVASAFKSIQDNAKSTQEAVDSAKEAITQGYLNALDQQTQAQETINDLIKQSAEEMRGFADGIREFLLEMATTDIGANSVADQLKALQVDFAATAALAKGGDKEAYGSITGKASSLLSAGKGQFSTAIEFARFSSSIGNTLSELATIADGKAGPLAEAVDPMIKAQAALLKANVEVAKWSAAISESGASTSMTLKDYALEWRTADAANRQAQADLKEAQLLTKDIDLKLLDVLGELKVLIGTYNQAKTAVVNAGGVLPIPSTNTSPLPTTTGITTPVTPINPSNPTSGPSVIIDNSLGLAAYSTWQGYMKDAGADLGGSVYTSIKQSAWSASGLSGVPSFAVGTNSVPTDMFANIHAGERIIPAADNTELMQRLSSPLVQDNSELVLEIQRLNNRLATIESNTASTAGHAAKTARLLDRAMPDGDALATRTAEAI